MTATLEVLEADITQLDVDAIVNAANEQLLPGGGVCGAIHHAAGPGLAADCAGAVAELGSCPTGKARITPGHSLRARWVIHAVGPVWQGGQSREAHLLSEAYRYSLRLAGARNLASIAFPAISTGIYGFPLAEATGIAVDTVVETLTHTPTIRRVVFATFGEEATRLYAAAVARQAAVRRPVR